MNSFLANRRQRVKVGNMHSEWATLSCGIPQGTVLGPTLFLVFINDLPAYLVGKPSIFAVDSTVFSRGNNKLETCQALTLSRAGFFGAPAGRGGGGDKVPPK